MAATANTGNRLRFYNGHEPPVFGPATQAQVDDAIEGVLSSKNNADMSDITGSTTMTVALQPANTSVFSFNLPNAATTSYEVVGLPFKMRVLDVWVVKTVDAAGAANTLQIKNDSANITDAIDTNKADTLVSRAGAIDDANATLDVTDTLTITNTRAGGAHSECIVYILVARVA